MSVSKHHPLDPEAGSKILERPRGKDRKSNKLQENSTWEQLFFSLKKGEEGRCIPQMHVFQFSHSLPIALDRVSCIP